jgi:hypothetical protein
MKLPSIVNHRIDLFRKSISSIAINADKILALIDMKSHSNDDESPDIFLSQEQLKIHCREKTPITEINVANLSLCITHANNLGESLSFYTCRLSSPIVNNSVVYRSDY